MMNDFEREEKIDRIIEKFIEEGIIEMHGIDSYTGEFTYKLTSKAKEMFPELYEDHFAHVNQMAFELWQKGLIEMKFDEDSGPMVMLKDLDYINEIFPTLSTEERMFIENMLYVEENKDDII